MAIDREEARNIFYIGTDSKLHQIVEGDDGWEMASNQSETEWPVADEPSAALALTYKQSESEVWIYYRANGTVMEAYRGYYGNWSEAQALPEAPPEEPDGSVNGTSIGGDSAPPEDDNKSDSGLSTGAKAGIGVGVGVGGLLVLSLLFFLWKRRRNTKAAAAADNRPLSEVEGSSAYSPKPQLYSPPQDSVKTYDNAEAAEMPSPPPPAELDHQPPTVFHELPAGSR